VSKYSGEFDVFHLSTGRPSGVHDRMPFRGSAAPLTGP
jgi:hypothetical protein